MFNPRPKPKTEIIEEEHLESNPITIDNMTDPNTSSFSAESLNDELKAKVVDNLLDTNKNKKVNSRINKAQVNVLTKLYVFGQVFNNDLVTSIADNILELQISLGGLGRKELVRILQSTTEMFTDEPKKKFKDIFR